MRHPLLLVVLIFNLTGTVAQITPTLVENISAGPGDTVDVLSLKGQGFRNLSG